MGTDRGSKEWQMRSLQAWVFSTMRRLSTVRDKQAHLAVAALLLLCEAVLCTLIVLRVPCRASYRAALLLYLSANIITLADSWKQVSDSTSKCGMCPWG